LGIGYVIEKNIYKTGDIGPTLGTIIYCSYDGTTLKVFDQNKKTKFTATVVKDGETLTISNYQHSSGEDYSYIAKTYAKQP
jgi:membrane-bound inhibitor of C-type lysozyme